LAVAAAVRFSPPRRYHLDANPERLSAEAAAARLDELPKPLSLEQERIFPLFTKMIVFIAGLVVGAVVGWLAHAR